MTKKSDDAASADQADTSDKAAGSQPVAQPSVEDMKRKFREALDKKHAHGGRDVSDDGDHSKIHDAHGPAKAQQMFRRKSGG